MLRFVTTADTEILATAAAVRRLPWSFPRSGARTPRAPGVDPFLDDVLADARVVVCSHPRRTARLAGRRRAPGGAVRGREIPLIALGGEASPDAEMTALSTRTGRGGRRRSVSTCATVTSTTSGSCCGSSPTRSCWRASGSSRPTGSGTSGCISRTAT